MWWLWLAEDCTGSKSIRVDVLSNLGPEVNNTSVLAVIGVVGISWESMAMAGGGIGVLWSVASSLEIVAWFLASVTRTSCWMS